MCAWTAPYLDYDDIREYAEAFLNKYNPDRGIPVPIEEIAENDLGLFIQPLPDLERRFDIDSYLESNQKVLCVDMKIFEHQLTRYRFSVAHEIGHIFLHGGLYKNADYKTAEDFIEFRNTLDSRSEYWVDIHAHNFAGLVLVPRMELRREFEECLEMVRTEGLEPYEMPEPFFKTAKERLAKIFLVGKDTIKWRVKFDNLWGTY